MVQKRKGTVTMSTKKQIEIDTKPYEQVADIFLSKNEKKFGNRARIFTQNINEKDEEVVDEQTNKN